MLNRCQSRQRNYSCNRSSTSSHVGAPIRYNCDMFEDYWEDASVSLRSWHSWEATSSPWLGASTPSAYEKMGGEDDCNKFPASGSPQIRSHSYSFDSNEHVISLKERRSFPPPLASCSTLSIKEGGRFVLKEMDADRPQGFFRAQRGNGRLRLELILPDEVNDEEDSQEESSSPVEDVVDCVESGHVEHGAHEEETISGILKDFSAADQQGMRRNFTEKVGSCESFDCSEGLWGKGYACEVEGFEVVRPAVQNVVSKATETNECSTSQANGMGIRHAELDKFEMVQQIGIRNSMVEAERRSSLDGFCADAPHRDIPNFGNEAGFSELDKFFTFGKLELNQLVTDSSNSNAEQDSCWNVDARNPALASLSPWSAKQIGLHQSIACLGPALGLAMS